MKFQLPKKIKGPQAWYGQKIGSSNEWIYSLSHQELKEIESALKLVKNRDCLLYTSPSPRDGLLSRMPSSA